MTYKVDTVGIDRIYLDNENPRHDPIESEPETIAHLLQNESVRQLARHIASTGSISPLERMGVVPHGSINNAYVSVEGNRRLCALKLLADPDKADTIANKKYFRALAEELGNISDIEVVIFSSHKEARPWVELRHEGEQDGVGVRPWNARQKARFDAGGESPTNPNIQATLLIDYAQRQGLLLKEKLDTLSVTTITRFLSNPVFRNTLGLQDNKTLTITVPQNEFNDAVTRFLIDALTPDSGVDSRQNSAKIKTYAENLQVEDIAPKTRGQEPTDLDVPSNSSLPLQETREAHVRNNKSPEKRKHVIPNNFSARINNTILKRLYDELRNLDADHFPFAAVYLCRGVLEKMSELFLELKNEDVPFKLHKKFEKMATVLGNDTQVCNQFKDQLKQLRIMANPDEKDSISSADSLGHFVHGGAVPTKEQAIRLWDSLETLIKHVLKEIEIENKGLAKHATVK